MLRRLTMLVLLATSAARAAPQERPRLIVLTDISSLEAGVAEPDDGQSMIRLMLYANEIDVEGLVASSNLGHGQTTRPDLIRRVVDAYERARPALLRHDGRYPPASTLASGIKAGQPAAGLKIPVRESVGEGRDTEASRWIIDVADRPDPRPVWVTIWGGSADLAQALWRVRKSRDSEGLERFVSRLRVHSIHDQDSTGPWIRDNFPGLDFIRSERAYRGMYRGGDTALVSRAWVDEHVKGHGPLGDLYPNYDGGDIWSRTMGPVRGIKEGDTPSFLHIIPNGLGDLERPWLGSWGGRFEGQANRFADVPDEDRNTSGDPDPRMSSVYRWREAFQADFRARLDWCVTPFAGANHPPVVRIRGERERPASPGETITLDAGETTDPDGDAQSYEWSIHPVRGDFRSITIEGSNSRVARLRVPEITGREVIPILLTVKDDGRPGLTRYGRILIVVSPTK